MTKKTKYVLVLLAITLNMSFVNAQNSFSDYVKNRYTKLDLLKLLTAKEAHAQQVIQNNEIAYTVVAQNPNIHSNPLQLDGKMLDYGTFDMSNKGVLRVVRGNPNAKDAEAIPFYVTIRSNGHFVQDKKMKFLNKAVYQVNLSDIFPFCQIDDVLIISPARPEDGKAKRILRLLAGGGC